MSASQSAAAKRASSKLEVKKEDGLRGSEEPPRETIEEKPKAMYKSWKKKYRKMRIDFDKKMGHGEELHRQEAQAAAAVKRLAIQNDRLLDILAEINNSPQIPLDKRFDVAQSTTKASTFDPDTPLKRLEQLLSEVPHLSYATTKEQHPEFLGEIDIPDGDTHPETFLNADDVDDYLYAIDATLAPEQVPPELLTRANVQPVRQPPNPHLKNPTSVTNWLRKHAPKIFLQDNEGSGYHNAKEKKEKSTVDKHADKETSEGAHQNGEDNVGEDGEAVTTPAPRKRGKQGEKKKRKSAAIITAEDDAEMDGSGGGGVEGAAVAPPPAQAAKGKRKREEDPGYRPKGGASRPTKKKRKSEGEAGATGKKGKKKSEEMVEDEDEDGDDTIVASP